MSPVNVVTVPSSRVATTPVTVRPDGVRLQALHVGAGHQGHVVLGQHRVDADDLRVRLGVEQAREAVDPVAADARARPWPRARLRLLEVDPDRQVERVQSQLLEVVAQLLDAGLVGHRRDGVLRAGWPSLGSSPCWPWTQVQVLGLGVVGLEVVVGDRPGRRDPAVVPELAEVLGSQAEQGRAVELGVAPDVVVDLGLELAGRARRTRPRVRGTCRARTPPASPSCRARGAGSAALQPEHLGATRGEPVPEGPATGPRPDDHDVVVLVSAMPAHGAVSGRPRRPGPRGLPRAAAVSPSTMLPPRAGRRSPTPG